MAPKRKSDASETTVDAPRRSTRTSTTKDASPPSKPASKSKAATKPASKGKENKKVKATEGHKEEPAAKKPKSDASRVIAVGETVPTVTVTDQEGKDRSLEELYKDRGLVIFSYPKANTPGCTSQACGYRDLYSDVTALGYDVFGVSTDSATSQKSWATKHSMQYPLLCDREKVLLKMMGACEGQSKRCHWIVEKVSACSLERSPIC